MPLYRRIARRGFSNYPFKKTGIAVVNVGELDKYFEVGAAVNLATLQAAGIVKSSAQSAKLLGDGKLTKKLAVSGVQVSASARAKIEKVGGTVAPASVGQE